MCVKFFCFEYCMQMEAGLSQWDDPQLKGTYIVGFSLSLII